MEDKDSLIKRMAKHYGESEGEVRKAVDSNPEILEGFRDYIANDYRRAD